MELNMIKMYSVFTGIVLFMLFVANVVVGENPLDADTLIVKRLSQKPVIDGKIDPSLKKNTASGSIRYLLGKEQKTAQVQTDIWCGYTDEGFYVAMECMEPQMDKLVKNPPGRSEMELWQGDSVEIFLMPPGDSMTRHFLLTAENLQGDYLEDSGADTELWNVLWQSAVCLGDDRWSVELFIPWKSLSLTGHEKGDWKANFIRTRWSANEFISWRHVNARYLEPQHFGTLRGLDLKFPASAPTEPIPPSALSIETTKLMNAALEKMQAVDLPKLAEAEPFRAAAWMAVLSSEEWVKRSLELYQTSCEKSVLLDRSISDLKALSTLDEASNKWLKRNVELQPKVQRRLNDQKIKLERAVAELQARLAILEGRQPAAGDAIVGLLKLAAVPESQVVVEFDRTRDLPNRKKGSITIDWGSLPLMAAQVEEFASPKLAGDAVGKFITPRTQKITIAENDAYFTHLPYWQPTTFDQYDPSKEFLLALTPRKIGLAPLAVLEESNVDALVFFSACPEKLKRDLTAWAFHAGKKIIDLSQIDPKKRIAFVGSPDESEMGKKIRQLFAYRFAVSSQTGVLRFTKGTLAFVLPCLSLDSGRLFAEAILNGRPISMQQVDRIRQAVVQAISRKPQPLKLPEGLDLYVGDVHDHTCYSDGSPTPMGLIAEAFYSHLDFCAISDHHYSRNGFSPLKPLMNKLNFNYSIIPSVELTYEWGHFNVYPLKENAENFNGCFFETVDQIREFARKQGNAVVQWSHPDDWFYTTRDDLRFDTDEGIDAWEVHPPRYDEWKKAGTLPVLTGGTDTHFGNFANPVRTIILAKSPSGDSLAGAIRSRNCALIDPYDGAHYEIYWECYRNPRMNTGADRYIYGDDKMIQLTVDALAEGKYLKENKKKQIQKTLTDFTPGKLLSSE
jgi:hypothetical protein